MATDPPGFVQHSSMIALRVWVHGPSGTPGKSHGRAQDRHTNGPNRVTHPVDRRHPSSPVDRWIFFSFITPVCGALVIFI